MGTVWANAKAWLRARMPPYKSETVAAGLGLYAAAVLVATLVWALAFSTVGHAPDYALNSKLIFRIEHAIALAALLIIPPLALAPLLVGRLPMSIGSGGIDWNTDRGNVVRALQVQQARIRALELAVNQILDELELETPPAD